MAELIPEDQADDPAKLLAEAHVLRWRAFRCFELSKLYETNKEQLARFKPFMAVGFATVFVMRHLLVGGL